MDDWYKWEAVDVVDHLGTDAAHGLDPVEVDRRLAQYGPNELIERGLKSPWVILWEQLTALMVIILIIAAGISALLGDYKDAVAIMAIVVLNALLGFHQEYRAEKALAALRKLAVPTVKVRRSGQVQEVFTRELVPGDIVLLEAGNLVPADCRVLESANLQIQEAALTGESEPVEKTSSALPGTALPLGDRRNMAYMGTVVSYGRGLAVVTETGMQTELGRIAEMIQTVEREPTPLQRRLAQVGRGLAVAALTLVTAVFALGLLRGEDARLMFLTAVSLAVAAVPEGLPAVVTIALALGAQRMLKRQALIRKLPAVETLGSVTVICSDKTGTLTENRMTVTVLDIANYRIDLSAYLHETAPIPEAGTAQSFILSDQPSLALLLMGGALCNDALLKYNGGKLDSFHTVGDPTEGALVVAAARLGLQKTILETLFPRIAEVPFESERKRMTTVHQLSTSVSHSPGVLEKIWQWGLGLGTPYLAFSKGAVDSLLDVSTAVWVNDHTEPMTEEWCERIGTANDQLAASGMRVLGVAFRPLRSLPHTGCSDSLERDLIFIGMIGMIDPPRPEVKEAVLTCKTAGIRPVMITGDHPLTAQHIAHAVSIAANGRLLIGQELNRLSIEALEGLVEKVSVYARVSPEHKLKIVQALQNRGHIVAMTGDGVNDAPALRKANIGVAMGITGTDVTKEAADMVLLDDNFATIVAAVEEGRIIYDNIRRFIRYLLSCNSGELWVMLLAPLVRMPLPLLPLQILWMNLVTDGLPALALGVEPAERDTMRRPPYPPNENIFGRGMGLDIIWTGLVLGLVSLGVGYWYWHAHYTHWQTMLFTTLTLSQMALALAVRSERDSLFRIGLRSNKLLLGAVALTFGLQLAVVYLPLLQGLFHTVALSAGDLTLSVILSTLVFWSVELQKWWLRHKQQDSK